MKLKILAVFSIALLFISLSGCLSTDTEPQGSWDDVISSYNPKTNQFEKFNGTVVVEDTVKSLEYISEDRKTKFILRSNPKVPVYLDETDNHPSDNTPDKTPWYRSGETVKFVVHIKKDHRYGEYIVELEP